MDGFGEEKDVSESDQEKLDALKVPIPIQEHERLAIIRQCNLLDTPNDETFDRYVSLAHRYFKVPIVLISLIDVDRQWFKSRIGLAAAETSRDVAFCAYTILDDTPRVMVVPDSFLDNRFKNNPLVRGPPYIRFYAGASIIVKGLKVATLCLIDNILHETLSREHEKILVGIADTISDIMTMRRQQKLEERFNGVFMHQSILTVIQDPLHRVVKHFLTLQTLAKGLQQVDAFSLSMLNELTREATAFQRQVLSLGNFLDDAMRVLARVILDPEQHVHVKKGSLGGKADGFLPCNVRAVLQSLQATLKESEQVKCPCELVVTVHNNIEQVESHADMILICFTALLHSYCATIKSKLWTTVKLIIQEDALVIEVLLPSVVNDEEVMQLFQQRLLSVKTMLAWVSGSLFMSTNEAGRVIMMRVPRNHQRHDSAASTLLLSMSGTSTQTAPAAATTVRAAAGVSPAAIMGHSKSISLLQASKEFASEVWNTITTTATSTAATANRRKVTPEPSDVNIVVVGEK